MENRATKSHYQDRVSVQGSTISRFPSNHYANQDSSHMAPEHHHEEPVKKHDEERSRKPTDESRGISSLIRKFLDFLHSDDALLLLIIVLLVQDGTDDEILILIIAYLLISGK